jgi:hypothetical protein
VFRTKSTCLHFKQNLHVFISDKKNRLHRSNSTAYLHTCGFTYVASADAAFFLEVQYVERQNVERQNVERQNVERQNVEIQIVGFTNVGIMNFPTLP